MKIKYKQLYESYSKILSDYWYCFEDKQKAEIDKRIEEIHKRYG